jgi:hypothetical protein
MSSDKFVWSVDDNTIPPVNCFTTFEWDYALNEYIQIDNFLPRISYLEPEDIYLETQYLQSAVTDVCCECENITTNISVCDNGCCVMCDACISIMEHKWSHINKDEIDGLTFIRYPLTTSNGCSLFFNI